MLNGLTFCCQRPSKLLLKTPVRSKKYYPGWRRLFELDSDRANLTQAKPSIPEAWASEWENAPIPRELKAFDLARLPEHLSVRGRKCLPIVHDHERRLGYQRRLFGKYGLASGVELSSLFHTPEDVDRETKLKRRMEPNVDEFKQQLAVDKQQKQQELDEKLVVICFTFCI